MNDIEHCPKAPDGTHCEHWWEGDTCGYCSAAPLDNPTRAEQGMDPYDRSADPHATREGTER